eukprot:753267-Rhodomonas_salina.2
MSGTDIAYAASRIAQRSAVRESCFRYAATRRPAMSGTDMAYGATVKSISCYATSSADIPYCAMRCPVLMQRMAILQRSRDDMKAYKAKVHPKSQTLDAGP